MTTEERIKQLEEEIRTTPYHKATEHHIGRLRARIAQLKDQQFALSLSKGNSGGGGYAVRQSGDASIALVGPPSVGKSTLINQLTNAQSKIGGFDFTTLSVIPGMMEFNQARFLIFDIPGIIEGASQGKGRGKEVLSVARSVDLLLIMLDAKKQNETEKIKKELYQFGLRLDEKPPLVEIKKTSRGSVKVITTTSLTKVSLETVKALAKEFRLSNSEITIREDIDLNRLIDAFMGNRVYLPYLVIVNKADLLRGKTSSPDNVFFISAKDKTGLNELKQAIWQKLNLIRVYLKPRSKEVDRTKPLITTKGTSLKQILDKLPLTNEEVKKAKIYGPGAKFEGQEVSFNFTPLDETIVSFF